MIEISGIFGYIGSEPCNEIVYNGIQKLKKRGFEAVGITTQNGNELFHTRLINDSSLPEKPLITDETHLALAECSQLIRGISPTAVLMPSTNNLYSVAVDGTIENFHQLKKWSGEPFAITSDEDLVLAMLCVTTRDNKPQDKTDTLQNLSSMTDGSPTIAFICNNQKAIYCVVGAKPLLIGIGKKGFCISSEINALYGVAEKYIALSKGELVKITSDKAYIYDSNLKKTKKSVHNIGTNSERTGEYSYNEQLLTLPSITKDIFNQYVFNNKICFEGLKLSSRIINRFEGIILTGSDSAFNMANILRSHLELMTDIPVFAIPSGELRHSGAIINSETLVIALSFSGEDTDTIFCTTRAKELGARTLLLSCCQNTQLERICHSTLVADIGFSELNSTAQCSTAIYFLACLLSLYISNKFDIAKDMFLNLAIKMSQMLSGKILSATKTQAGLTMLATRLSARNRIIVTGLGADYPLSVECASILNSISSINCVPCSVCSLLSVYGSSISGQTVIVPITNEDYLRIIIPYLLRAKVLGAEIIILTLSSIEEEIKDFESIVSFDDSIPLFNPLIIMSAIYKTTAIIDEINNSNRLDDVV